MSENIYPFGEITTIQEVLCGCCSEGFEHLFGKKQENIKLIREWGWSKTKRWGWICPECNPKNKQA